MNKPKLSKSGVSWTDYSWGVVDGCTKVSAACQNCYAEAMVTRFQPDRKFSDVICHSERLEAPLNTKKGGKVFVAPLGDLFHPDAPFEFIDAVFGLMAMCPQHTFQILTKRPEIMQQYFVNRANPIWYRNHAERIQIAVNKRIGQFPKYENCEMPFKNVWLGVTAENQEQADKRIPILLQIPAAVRFVSIEPMLGPVDLDEWIYPCGCEDHFEITNCEHCNNTGYFSDIDLVIAGCESGPRRRKSNVDDFRALNKQCQKANIKFFLKQIEIDGKIDYSHVLDGREWKQFPEVV